MGRKRWLRACLAGLLAAGLAGGAVTAQPSGNSAKRSAQRLLVKPKHVDARSNDTAKAVNGARIERVFRHLGNLQVLELPPGLPTQVAIDALKRAGVVDYAEADQVVRLRATEPNDPKFANGELWGLRNTVGGVPGVDIKAAEGWDIRRDAPNVIVALVDSGVRLTHQDLAPNLWRNTGEIAGNGIDDDRNGVVDDMHGFNAWADNGNPADDIGHGTHVAGSIGAAGNNALGVVGVAWRVQLMATKFTDPNGEGTVSDAIACIDYARQMGAHIINASWGGPDLFNSTALRDAIAAARDAGIIFVTVAGNNQGNNDLVPYYPGAFDLDNIVVATAIDRYDRLAWFANYGALTVDLGAPGHEILSAWVGHDADYSYMNGGSMAVAYVSGAAALLRAHFPGDDYRTTIRRILENTEPMTALAGKTKTGGRLNLFRALTGGTTAPVVPSVTIAATDATASESAGDAAVFTVSRTGPTASPLTVIYTVSGSATNGADFAALTGTVVIPAGAAAATVSVVPVDDVTFEGSESVTLTLLAGATYTLGTATTASVTIADNDAPPLPTVTIAAVDANATEGGVDTGTLTISRSGATTAALTVNVTISGSATSGVDFDPIATAVTIPAGAAAATVVVRTREDSQVEPVETVTVTLSSGATYTLGSAVSATVSITDNDQAQQEPPAAATTVSIRATSGYALELGWSRGEFTVKRDGGSTATPLTVRLNVSGTASAGSDYDALPATVTIPAGRSSVSVSVQPKRDRRVERTETVIVTVGNGAGYAPVAGSGASATVFIVDDDWFWEFLRDVWR